MPCIPIIEGRRRVGFLCVGNEPVQIKYSGKTFYFEWTAASGWLAVNRDGSERLTRVPNGVWDALAAAEESGEVVVVRPGSTAETRNDQS